MMQRRDFLATAAALALAARQGSAARAQEQTGGIQPIGRDRAGAHSRRIALRRPGSAAGEPREPLGAGLRRDPLPRRAQALRRPADRLRRRPHPLRLHLRHPGPDRGGRGRGGAPDRLRPGALHLRRGPAARRRRAARLRRLPRPDRPQRARRLGAVRDLRRRQLLPGGRPQPGLRHERPRPRGRHRRAARARSSPSSAPTGSRRRPATAWSCTRCSTAPPPPAPTASPSAPATRPRSTSRRRSSSGRRSPTSASRR